MTYLVTPPPITDHLPIALRAFVGPTWTELKEPTEPKPRKPPRLPASSRTIIFDTETTSSHAQSLRFGIYQVRDNGVLVEAGILYDPDGVTPDELEALRTYAEQYGLRLLTRAEFVEEIFYGIGYDLHANIVGFNLPFDISRLAIGHGSARGKMRGGFTFKLSEHLWSIPNRGRPNVQIKHISSRSAFIQFAAVGQPQSGAGQRHKRKVPTRRGHFIDVRTLAGALLARPFTLAGLGKHLEVRHPKLEFDDFDGPIDDEMIGYAVRDVQATWECFEALASRFGDLGLTRTGPNRVYSEAGIGKAFLKEMGIESWMKVQPYFPRQLLGNIMGSYHGGRSEVRIRREMRQVMLCDFLSMYPTVCILMGLWQFVIAEGMTWRDTTDETRALLAGVDLATLRSPETWRHLTTLVRIKPDADIFPVRADYADTEETTIGVNYLSGETPQWFTLADCLASKMLTGKASEIVEAITFAPGPVQSGLKSIEIGGEPVDPVAEDFYARVIALRQKTKAAMKAATTDADRKRFDVDQFSLKICANSTSYGIFLEINAEEVGSAFGVTVHNGIDDPFDFPTAKYERPGPFFHPLLGTLITGAARLMLAITERLIAEEGLEWAFCDTDSMAIARPNGVTAEQFQAGVESIVDWFVPLNPHGAGSILQVEEVNKVGNVYTSLYVWAISAKRYALFNLDDDGRPIIRKASGHGLGHLLAPYGADNPAPGIPAPRFDLDEIGVPLWQHDIWWRIITAALDGHPGRVILDHHPALAAPALSRYGATSPHLERWFKRFNEERDYRDRVKPFNFLTSLSVNTLSAEPQFANVRKGRPRKHRPIKPIAPFTRDPEEAADTAFDRDTGEPIARDSLRSYARALVQYHIHPEGKFGNGDYTDHGMTERRHVRAVSFHHIGKESTDWEERMYLAFADDPVPHYGASPDEHGKVLDELRRVADRVGRKVVAHRLGLSLNRTRALLASHNMPARLRQKIVITLPGLRDVVDAIDEQHATEFSRFHASVRADGWRATARSLGLDPSNLRRRLKL